MSKKTTYQVITEIYEQENKVTPDLLVEYSRPEDAPLHNRFEWDDTLAGHQYRKVQARHIINTVKIEIPNQTEAEVTPAMVSVVDENNDRAYIPTVVAMLDVNMREFVLSEAMHHLNGARERYQSLADISTDTRLNIVIEKLDDAALVASQIKETGE